MQSPFRARNWILFIAINILVSAVTAFIVVRALTQAASRPTINPSTSAVAQVPAPDNVLPENALPDAAVATPQPMSVTPTVSSLEVAANAQPANAPVTEATPQAQAPAAPATAAEAPQTVGNAQADVAANVRISTVVYPGQRSREAVVIVNEGDQVDMTGWTLSNPRGKIYTFGNVVLFKDSFINLHTTTGVDVPTDLFWKQEEAVWQAGDVATLKRGNQVVATFTVK